MDRKLLLAAVAVSVGALGVFSCVGDDPSPSGNPTIDGGATDTGSATDTGTSGGDSGGDGGVPPVAVVDVSAGDAFGCAVRVDGSVVCWGTNVFGEAGQPATGGEKCDGNACRLPTVVSGITGAIRIASGPHQSCAVTNGGKVFCWGANDGGVLGHSRGTDPDCGGGRKCNEKPTEVANVSGAIGVAVGRTNACAWNAAGNVSCWGNNRIGQLGRGTPNEQDFGADSALTFATNGASAIAVDSYGNGHFCAIRADGTLSCWGRNNSNELGKEKTTSPVCTFSFGTEYCEGTPIPVNSDAGAALKVATSVASTDGATCASLGNDVYCWGYVGHGVVAPPNQLPSDQVPAINAPAAGLSGLSGTFTHVCGLTAGRDVKCWGENHRAQLGVDPSAATQTCVGPVACTSNPVTTGVKAKKVAAGPGLSLAITLDDKVLAWGGNERAQLGHLPRTGENKCAQPCNPTPEEVVMP